MVVVVGGGSQEGAGFLGGSTELFLTKQRAKVCCRCKYLAVVINPELLPRPEMSIYRIVADQRASILQIFPLD